jgi:hypothetical protein
MANNCPRVQLPDTREIADWRGRNQVVRLVAGESSPHMPDYYVAPEGKFQMAEACHNDRLEALAKIEDQGK